MSSPRKQDLLRARQARYRRRMDLRVTTPDEAVQFVAAVGFCFLFPIQGIEMPSLWDAIAGRVVEVLPLHTGYEIERTWGWKDALLNQRRWYYGKLIRGKATLAALDFLPYFYALSRNYSDYESDYLDEYREGLLSAEAKTIYETLLEKGALNAVQLRKEARLSAESSKSRFERALTELQTGLKVLPIGIAEAGAWRYAFIYEILPRWLPDVAVRARSITREQARRAILHRYLQNVVFAAPRDIARIFGWPLAETRQSAEALAAENRILLDVKVTGIGERMLVRI